MKRSRKSGLILLGASATVLAATSQRWSAMIGVGQGAALIGMGVLYAVLVAVVLHVNREPMKPAS